MEPRCIFHKKMDKWCWKCFLLLTSDLRISISFLSLIYSSLGAFCLLMIFTARRICECLWTAFRTSPNAPVWFGHSQNNGSQTVEENLKSPFSDFHLKFVFLSFSISLLACLQLLAACCCWGRFNHFLIELRASNKQTKPSKQASKRCRLDTILLFMGAM